MGKANAVKTGLKFVNTENVLLFDSNWINFNTENIKNAISRFEKDGDIDMIVLYLADDGWIFKLLRSGTVVSGQRILRKKDLVEVFKMAPSRYQLELVTNDYMTKEGKNIIKMPLSGKFVSGYSKLGMFKGLKKDFKMWRNIFSYKGILFYLKNLLTFAK